MLAIREYATVKDHQLHIVLPQDFNFEEVEVIVLPRSINALPDEQDLLDQTEQIGKIGFHSHSFVEDDEDYSQW
jgi:hypothetical protein